MRPVLRYDESGTVHDELATVDAVEAALSRLDNVTRTSLVVEVGEADAHQTIVSLHGHVAGPLVCSWVKRTADDVEFERWLRGPSAADGKIKVRVWGVDSLLPARFAVSAEAAALRVRSFLAGEDLGQCGPWEDAL
jgi:hypothetical protein